MPVKATKASRHLEVERKFDVDESTLSPSFAGIAAITRVQRPATQTLDAVYVDTPTRDLASRRITLRRRTGGVDAGWHLKLPAGPDARTEIRVPLGATDGGRDEVPGELLDVVSAIVRDRPLGPVARITTTRDVGRLCGDDGAVVAEFCDDKVVAWCGDSGDEDSSEQRWREWELELVGSGEAPDTDMLQRLTNRLLDAGATPARHGSKLARVLGATQHATPPAPADPVHRALAEQVDELLAWDRAVRADADDAVHQMRVTIRKIRSLLQAAPESFGLSDDSWIVDELRELAAVLGAARDAEVLADRYQRALDGLPPELVRGAVRARLVGGARQRYAAGLRRSLIALRSTRYFRLLDALDAVLVAPAGVQAPPEAARSTVHTVYRRMRRAAKTAARAPEAERNEALHQIRKKAKQLRYTAAATGEMEVSKGSAAIQTLLGDHQDSVVSRAHLSQQAAAAHAAGDDTFTYGLLYQQEVELARRCRRQLRAALHELDRAVRTSRE
ncbi:CYTH and CHAD domain-containing protein [Mycobacterium sp.]|uniref:CYTH and CHAD domain-containing protein n=1 Tax=Mycobacterium sp. TaxID=1785 RepID=UPI0031D86C10